MRHPLSRPCVEAIIVCILHIEERNPKTRANLRDQASTALLKLVRSEKTDTVEKALIYGFLQVLAYKKIAFIQRRFHDQALTAIRDIVANCANVERGTKSTEAQKQESAKTTRCIQIFRDQLFMQMEATAIATEDTKTKLMESKGLRGLSQQKAIAQHTKEAGETKIAPLFEQVLAQQGKSADDSEDAMGQDDEKDPPMAPENMLTVLIEELSEADEARAGMEDSLSAELR